jgi:hypothetical protein
VSDAQALLVTVVALVGGFCFEWALASFGAYREVRRSVPDSDRAKKVAVIRDTLREANEMWRQGTSGCRDGTEADIWLPKYASWVAEAKARIEREVSLEEAILIFEIGDMSKCREVRGQNRNHSHRLTCLADHREKLEEALWVRFLPAAAILSA